MRCYQRFHGLNLKISILTPMIIDFPTLDLGVKFFWIRQGGTCNSDAKIILKVMLIQKYSQTRQNIQWTWDTLFNGN